MFLRILTCLSIYSSLQFIVFSGGTPRTTSQTKLSPFPVILIVSFDGFRHSYLHQNLTPVLTKLSTTGATVPYLIPSFPTKTFPNHHSIATGLFTETHGITDMQFYDSLYNATLDGKKNTPGFWNYDEDVLPLWIRNELNGGVSGCLNWPGSSDGYGEDSKLFPTYFYPRYNRTVPWESRVDTVISWMTDSERPANLIYLYYDQPDSAGHRHGPNGKETLAQVVETDKRVELLIGKLKEVGIYENVNLVLLSDHGLEEVTLEREIDLSEFLDTVNLVFTTEGASMLVQVVPKSGKEGEVYEALMSGSRSRNFTVFKKSEMCGEPYFYCESSRRIHDYIVLADPGWIFRDFRKNKKKSSKKRKVYGSHGCINTVESMRAFFIANGPDFKNGYVTEKPVKNVDIVPLLSKILGLEGVPSNGSLSRVEGMLKGHRETLSKTASASCSMMPFAAFPVIIFVVCQYLVVICVTNLF